VYTVFWIPYDSFSSNVSWMRVRLLLNWVLLRRGSSQYESQDETKVTSVSCASLTRLGVIQTCCGRAEALTSTAKSLLRAWRQRDSGPADMHDWITTLPDSKSRATYKLRTRSARFGTAATELKMICGLCFLL
jgi:hypothetical protein